MNDKNFPKSVPAIFLMFLFTGFEMLMVVVLSPPETSFDFVRDIYPVMLFTSVIGITLFSVVVRDEREKMKPDADEELMENDEIQALKSEISELRTKTENLINETKALKNETKKLKNYNKELKNIIEDLRKE